MIDRIDILSYYNENETLQKWNVGTGCLVKNTKGRLVNIRDIVDRGFSTESGDQLKM